MVQPFGVSSGLGKVPSPPLPARFGALCHSLPCSTACHIWRQPGTRHRFAPARLGLGCGSSTPRPHGTDGDSACLVAVPSRQAVVAGAQSPLQPSSSPPSWAGRVVRR